MIPLVAWFAEYILFASHILSEAGVTDMNICYNAENYQCTPPLHTHTHIVCLCLCMCDVRVFAVSSVSQQYKLQHHHQDIITNLCASIPIFRWQEDRLWPTGLVQWLTYFNSNRSTQVRNGKLKDTLLLCLPMHTKTQAWVAVLERKHCSYALLRVYS